MINDNITADRDFILGLLSVSIAATRLIHMEPEIETLIEMVAPTDEETEDMFDAAMAQFNLIKEIDG